MGKDGQPKHKQEAREIRRKKASRGMYERVLIVCEGEKTEPNYLNELRSHFRLPTANIVVRPSELGTSPIQVVQYAQQLFEQGDAHHGLAAREFDRIYAVFDRDDHETYHDALAYCAAHTLALRNSERQRVPLIAVPSVPCFELWLLLHYEDVLDALHRNDVYARLKRHLPDYDKGNSGYWSRLQPLLADAQRRAQALAQRHSPEDGQQPCTGIGGLVAYLSQLKS
jgi:hypothetical protein